MNQRDNILSLLNGQPRADVPAFSGLLHVTAAGLASEGLTWREVHHDARKMAQAAASTYRLTGLPSVTLPLDLTAPAEALGAELVFYSEDEFQFPQVKKALVESARELTAESTEILKSGRIPLILDAIRLAKADVGGETVLSGLIPGPYTLLLYLCNPTKLFLEMRKSPQPVADALFHLSSILAQIGQAYRAAGADYITIHEMGGSPGFLGPARFEKFVLPALKELIGQLPAPRVLSVCGNTNASMNLLAQSGAEALSVDQVNDLAASRAVLKDTLLFGNLDPLETISMGNAAQVGAAAARTREAGVDAVWPGCDLLLQTPVKNIQALQPAKP